IMSNYSIQSYLELAARIYVWITLSIYGSGKIMGGQFYRAGQLPEEIAQLPLAEIKDFDLAWTFFGYSTLYIFFIGISQLIGALLLLFERTKLLGIAILIPILLNIIIVDIAFKISWGATTSAIMYLLALIYVLYCNKERVIGAFQKLTQKRITDTPFQQKKWLRIIIAIGIFAGIFFVEQQLLNFVGR
ncbi:MAG: hypothetical protein AAFP82_21785, partial [Bacteroidota bacterium]